MSDIAVKPPLTIAATVEEARAKRHEIALKPEGHNAFWENARPWLVFVGATVLTAIATYVMAKDSLDRLAAGSRQPTDVIATAAAIGLGMLVDAAIVIAGMRAHQERGIWKVLAITMFSLCIGVESMTLAYFYKLIQPDTVPVAIRATVDFVHDCLYAFRSFLPPMIVAFLAVAVRNLIYTNADRKRRMAETTGKRLVTLEDILADPKDASDKSEVIREYAGQLALFEYATDANEAEVAANKKLVEQFKATWKVDDTSHHIDVQKAIQDAIGDIYRQMLPWLIQVLETQQWPDELLAYAPEYARIDPVKLLKSAGIKTARVTKTNAQGEPIDLTSSANGNDQLRAILVSILGIKEVKVSFKTRDIWLVSRDMVTISGGVMDSEAATKLAKELGKEKKQGLSYIFPLRAAIPELASRNQLQSDLLAWHKAQDKTPKEEAEAPA